MSGVVPPLIFQFASSGRSNCKKCSESIENNSARVGVEGKHKGSYGYFHPGCAIDDIQVGKTSKGLKCKACKEEFACVIHFGMGKESQYGVNVCVECLEDLRVVNGEEKEDSFIVDEDDLTNLEGFEQMDDTMQSAFVELMGQEARFDANTLKKVSAPKKASVVSPSPKKKKEPKVEKEKVVKKKSTITAKVIKEDTGSEKKPKKEKEAKLPRPDGDEYVVVFDEAVDDLGEVFQQFIEDDDITEGEILLLVFF